MFSAVAGTFNILHSGHKELIDRAFDIGDEVFIGITTDRMASSNRSDIVSLYLRRKELECYLSNKTKPWSIIEIDNIYGPLDKMDKVDILVVSEETLDNGKKLNEERKSRGIRPLELCVIPLKISSDGKKISSTGILEGRYARNGESNVMNIAVGSLNHIKIEAVRTVMERVYGDVKITAIDADSGVPPQPFESETRLGAINRARNAIGMHMMSVGIEAGVFEKPDGLYDYQYCAILDREGKMTIGTGCGFRYPDKVADLVRTGYTVGDAVHEIYGNIDIGKKQGAVGLLSKGLLDRKNLTEQSVTAAMIPRLWDE